MLIKINKQGHFLENTRLMAWYFPRCGILGYIGDDYIVEPLGGQTTFTLSVPENGNVTTGGFGIQSYSAVPGKIPSNALDYKQQRSE